MMIDTSVAMMATCRLSSKRLAISSVTGRPVHMDSPRSKGRKPDHEVAELDIERVVQTQIVPADLDLLGVIIGALAAELQLADIAG